MAAPVAVSSKNVPSLPGTWGESSGAPGLDLSIDNGAYSCLIPHTRSSEWRLLGLNRLVTGETQAGGEGLFIVRCRRLL